VDAPVDRAVACQAGELLTAGELAALPPAVRAAQATRAAGLARTPLHCTHSQIRGEGAQG
jgi:hypothetical protein